MNGRTRIGAVVSYGPSSFVRVRPLASDAYADVQMAARDQLLYRIATIHRGWRKRLDRTRKAEIRLGRRLLRCSDPANATRLCDERMFAQAIKFASDMRTFEGICRKFASHAEPKRAKSSTARNG